MADAAAPAQPDVKSERIPAFAFPEAPARVLSKVAAYAEWRAQPPGVIPDFDDLSLSSAQAICASALKERRGGWLSAVEVRDVLTAVGVPLAPGGVARTADEAVAFARQLGLPVPVKLPSPPLLH